MNQTYVQLESHNSRNLLWTVEKKNDVIWTIGKSFLFVVAHQIQLKWMPTVVNEKNQNKWWLLEPMRTHTGTKSTQSRKDGRFLSTIDCKHPNKINRILVFFYIGHTSKRAESKAKANQRRVKRIAITEVNESERERNDE